MPTRWGSSRSAFDSMRLRLAALDRARGEFIANASHELRTPLFSLGGFLELLADEDLDEETRRDFLAEMRGQIDRLTRLATDLLDLSRLDAGQLEVERQAGEPRGGRPRRLRGVPAGRGGRRTLPARGRGRRGRGARRRAAGAPDRPHPGRERPSAHARGHACRDSAWASGTGGRSWRCATTARAFPTRSASTSSSAFTALQGARPRAAVSGSRSPPSSRRAWRGDRGRVATREHAIHAASAAAPRGTFSRGSEPELVGPDETRRRTQAPPADARIDPRSAAPESSLVLPRLIACADEWGLGLVRTRSGAASPIGHYMWSARCAPEPSPPSRSWPPFWAGRLRCSSARPRAGSTTTESPGRARPGRGRRDAGLRRRSAGAQRGRAARRETASIPPRSMPNGRPASSRSLRSSRAIGDHRRGGCAGLRLRRNAKAATSSPTRT